MLNLQELVYIVTKNKIKSIETLDTNSSSRLFELYEGVLNGKFKSDSDATEYFFGSKTKYKSYYKLKTSLKKRLLNTIFFIDAKKPYYNDRQTAYYECQREWAAANILFAKNAHSTAVDIGRHILKHAQKYEFTGLVVDISRKLCLYYGTNNGNRNKYDFYSSLQMEYEPILQAEKKAEHLYLDLVIKFVKNKSAKRETSLAASSSYKVIHSSLKKYQSYALQFYGGLIKLMIYTALNDYDQALEVCDDIIFRFENKEYQAHTPLNIAYYQKLVCYTQLKEYEKGREVAQKCISLIQPGSFNWFKYHELYLILLLHTKRYPESIEVLKKVKKHKRFNFLPENIIEIWKIFEAYIFYLKAIEVLDVGSNDPKFRLAKFLNDTPIFTRDKAGLNISILIIQILFLIEKKEYNKIIDKAESIDKYCNKYLKKQDTIRAYYFIKMLISIPAASFDKTLLVDKANKYFDELMSHPFEVASQGHNIEIIPYETLWKYALDTL